MNSPTNWNLLIHQSSWGINKYDAVTFQLHSRYHLNNAKSSNSINSIFIQSNLSICPPVVLGWFCSTNFNQFYNIFMFQKLQDFDLTKSRNRKLKNKNF